MKRYFSVICGNQKDPYLFHTLENGKIKSHDRELRLESLFPDWEKSTSLRREFNVTADLEICDITKYTKQNGQTGTSGAVSLKTANESFAREEAIFHVHDDLNQFVAKVKQMIYMAKQEP